MKSLIAKRLHGMRVDVLEQKHLHPAFWIGEGCRDPVDVEELIKARDHMIRFFHHALSLDGLGEREELGDKAGLLHLKISIAVANHEDLMGKIKGSKHHSFPSLA